MVGEPAPAGLRELPEHSRLLHIGLMKTGTTAIQRAASARRRQLLSQGVLYPGSRYNHRQAALALMRRRSSGAGADAPHDEWERLRVEIDDEPQRKVLVSNEFICGADDTTAQRFLDDLGPRTHVVVTVRNVASVLPSLWQQYVKSGSTWDLESFLRIVLADPLDPDRLPPHYARNDQGTVVARWARLVGAEHLTVVVADPAHPERVQGAFETLLGLRPGALAPVEQSGFHRNRSLSAAEAALFLEVNRRLPAGAMTEDERVRILLGGAVRRVLDQQTPRPGDPGLGLPAWAADRAAELGQEYARAIAATGVRVVGDLTELGQRSASAPEPTLPHMVPVDLAAVALLGAMSAGLHRGSDFGPPTPEVVRTAPPARRRVRALARRLVVAARVPRRPAARTRAEPSVREQDRGG